MWIKTTTIIIIFIVCTLSILEIIQNRKKRAIRQSPQETLPGEISKALTYLVGVAGGIYLSLTLLTSFLGIVFPESVQILGVPFDPLAFIALLLALAQPWIMKLYYFIIKK